MTDSNILNIINTCDNKLEKYRKKLLKNENIYNDLINNYDEFIKNKDDTYVKLMTYISNLHETVLFLSILYIQILTLSMMDNYKNINYNEIRRKYKSYIMPIGEKFFTIQNIINKTELNYNLSEILISNEDNITNIYKSIILSTLKDCNKSNILWLEHTNICFDFFGKLYYINTLESKSKKKKFKKDIEDTKFMGKNYQKIIDKMQILIPSYF